MRLRDRYARLSFWNKLGVWGAAASLVGLTFALLLFVVDRTNPLSSPPVVSSVPSQVQDRYQALLFSATKELENDRIYSDSLRRLLRDPHLAMPFGSLRSDQTLELLKYHYTEITQESYGEEKHLYDLALKLQDAGASLSHLQRREELLSWNSHHELTVDDVSFLCGFLNWYVGVQAQDVLGPKQRSALSNLSRNFVPEAEVSHLEMRYFVLEGKPINDYLVYLGIID